LPSRSLHCRGALVRAFDLHRRGANATADSVPAKLDLPPRCGEWFRNPDGSCVQCSIGNVRRVVQRAGRFDVALGHAVWQSGCRGGSWPDRVADYCEAAADQSV
jgi:hypothetical protein